MHTDPSADSNAPRECSASPSDSFLIAGVISGDAAALRKLMDRYDRLVRYTIFRASKDRCLADPEWLESLSSETWTGFVGSAKRDPDGQPKSLRAYLVQIARHKVVSALRRKQPDAIPLYGNDDSPGPSVAAELEEPTETLARLELLEALRDCLEELDAEDRALATQLRAITDRRWKEAAEALGMAESTLRSRWARVLARLRRCIGRKTGADSLAPPRPDGDS